MRAVVFVAGLLALAGCTSPAPSTCPTDGCPTPASDSPSLITRPPGVDFPAVPANETLRSLRLENCTGLDAGFDLPPDRVDPFVPDAFEAFSNVPATWRVSFQAITCERAVFAGQVYQGFQEFRVGPKVVPVNDSWYSESSASFFLIDNYISVPEIAAAMRSWGIRAEVASISNTQSGSLSSWVVTAANASFAFQYPTSPEHGNFLNLTNYLWQGDGPFLRMALAMAITHDLLYGPGALQISGRSQTGDLVGSPFVDWTGGAIFHLDVVAELDPQLFGMEASA